MIESINIYRTGFIPKLTPYNNIGQINKISETGIEKTDYSKKEKQFQYIAPSRNQDDRFEKSSNNPDNQLETDYTKFLFRGGSNQKNVVAQDDKPQTGQKNNNEESINNLETEKNQAGRKELSEAEKKQVEKLKKMDREVKAHESAHKAAGGSLVSGGASYTYVTGPDGRKYANSGEVQIDISYDLDNPQKTIEKMRHVRRAALAPSDPSAQDRSVAAKSSQIEAKARAELAKSQNGDTQESATGKMKTNKDSRIAAYLKAAESTEDFVANSFNKVSIDSKQKLDVEDQNIIRM